MFILTFDIEDWFHLLDYNGTENVGDWDRFDSRVGFGVERILEFLESHDLKATFFIVGWIAERHPNIVKMIAKRGFEIGSHTHTHRLLYKLSRFEAREEISSSIDTIENLTGEKVTSFRAPGFSIREGNQWVFNILAECGITIDSSIFPANRAHGGYPNYGSNRPSIIDLGEFQLKEFPINTTRILSREIIFSGGGYFRILPYPLIKYWSSNANYVMTYFHPRDFDASQPRLPDLGIIRAFKTYVGLKNCMTKLDKWVSDFKFIDLRTANQMINWSQEKVIHL